MGADGPHWLDSHGMSGRFWVEDEHGVGTAELNKQQDRPAVIAVAPGRRYYLRGEQREAPFAVPRELIEQGTVVTNWGNSISATVAEFPALSIGLMSALLLLCVLRAVSHYAAIRGIELAADVVRILPNQPDVTIYSVKGLELQPSIVETAIPGESSAYHFKYSGLKLLFRSDNRFFLRPSDPSDTRNIILADTSDIRLEYRSSS